MPSPVEILSNFPRISWWLTYFVIDWSSCTWEGSREDANRSPLMLSLLKHVALCVSINYGWKIPLPLTVALRSLFPHDLSTSLPLPLASGCYFDSLSCCNMWVSMLQLVSAPTLIPPLTRILRHSCSEFICVFRLHTLPADRDVNHVPCRQYFFAASSASKPITHTPTPIARCSTWRWGQGAFWVLSHVFCVVDPYDNKWIKITWIEG